MTIHDARKITAVLVVLDVIAVYVYCLGAQGVYPTSHPLSAITLILLSLLPIFGSRNREQPNWVSSSWLFLVGVILTVTLWTVSSVLRR